MKKWMIGLMLLAVNAFAAQPDMITKVINLQYQNANTIIQLVQPLLQSGEQISGSGQTLVVKVSPDTLTQIRALLHKLDQPPVSFEIAIFQGPPDWLSNQSNNTITVGTNSQMNQQRSQSVTVMNGQSAFVSTGQSQPMISSVGVGWQTGVSYNQQLVQNGLLVEPVLQGQQVRLSVKRVRQQDSNVSNQQINQQEVNTTVMVPLNQWVPLSSAQGGEPVTDSSTITFQAGNNFATTSTLYVKVNIIQGGSTDNTN